MQKERKFRVWDTKRKDWYKTELEFKGFSLFGECMLVCPPRIEDLGHLEVSEYIGMNDIKGVDVYEGDVYKNHDNGLIGVLKINTSICYEVWASEFKDGELYNHMPFATMDTTNIEVVGNIFKDEELVRINFKDWVGK